MKRVAITLLSAALACAAPTFAATISYVGDLRADATFVSCGLGCTLGAADSDRDYAQYAAVVETFTVSSASSMQAISFSYGGLLRYCLRLFWGPPGATINRIVENG